MAKTIMDSDFKNWTPDRLPGLTGKTVVITGGNAGLGFETAKLLGAKGADLVLACRSPEKAAAAKAALEPLVKGMVDLVTLDLSDLSSVRAAVDEVRSRYTKVDALLNNAGIMQTPKLKTKDGFEMQIGTNHLGHFLWTSLLIDLVEAAGGRVVSVSSIAHKYGKIHLDNLMLDKGYSPSKSYFQSKLANIIFGFELDRRLGAAGCRAISIACHPGYSATNLQSTGPTGLMNAAYKVLNPMMAQKAELGAYPLALAAAGTEAKRGGYYGPTGMADGRGPVGDSGVAKQALDVDVAKKLWAMSEELLGITFQMPSAAQAA